MSLLLLLRSVVTAGGGGTPITGSGLRVGVDVAVELNGMGGGWTTISNDVIQEQGIEIYRGIQGSTPNDRLASTGTASFTLNNSANNSAHLLGYYSLHHANKRSGWDLNIGCRIRLQDPATLTWYTQFIGKIDVINVEPAQFGTRAVHVTAVDWMDEAARWALVPEIGEQLNKRGDEIMTAILAQMPVQPPNGTSFDPGKEIYARALDQSASAKQPATAEFQKLAASEFGFVYLKGDGTLRYESRYTRLQQTASLWTIADASEQDLEMPSGRDRVINNVLVTVHPKIVDATPTTIVYTQANTIRIAPAETKTLLGEYKDPLTGDRIGATNIQALVAGLDYTANSDPMGIGTDLTDRLSVTANFGPAGVRFSIINTGVVDAHLTKLQVRGAGVYDRGEFTAPDRDATSVGKYGQHDFTYDMPYQTSQEIAQGAAGLIKVSESAEVARPHAVSVFGKNAATITQLLTREISDRVKIQETVTGVNDDFFINGLELKVFPNRYLQGEMTLGYVKQSGYWLLGTSTLGSSTLLAPL